MLSAKDKIRRFVLVILLVISQSAEYVQYFKLDSFQATRSYIKLDNELYIFVII